MKIGLGTVQFGLDYGVSNEKGKVRKNEIDKIFNFCKEKKITLFDTAPEYGDSEEVIQKFLLNNSKVITKTKPIRKKIIEDDDIKNVIESLEKSFSILDRKHIEGVLFHDARDLLSKNSEKLYDEVHKYKKEGKILKIGVSIYNKEQIDLIVEKYKIDILQIPLNILDQRLLEGNYLKTLKEKGIEIHVRSIHLQGLLLMDLGKISSYFSPIMPILCNYREDIGKLGISPLLSVWNFIKSIEEIDYVIFGVESKIQLEENLEAFESKRINIDYERYKVDNLNFIEPFRWRIN